MFTGRDERVYRVYSGCITQDMQNKGSLSWTPDGPMHRRWQWNDLRWHRVTYILLCTCGKRIFFNWLEEDKNKNKSQDVTKISHVKSKGYLVDQPWRVVLRYWIANVGLVQARIWRRLPQRQMIEKDNSSSVFQNAMNQDQKHSHK